MTTVISSLQDIMLISLILGCPDQTYSVPTSYTLPSESTTSENEKPSYTPRPSGENQHPEADAPPPEADAPPPPDGVVSGDEPPPNDEALRPHPSDQDVDGSDTPKASDGCIISHNWKELRSEDIEKVIFKASFETEEFVQHLLVDFISPRTREVKAGIICPSKEIEVAIPKNLGIVQVAIFIDSNQNGPSVDDLQGISEQIEIKDEEITITNITLSTTPLSYYNFKEK